MSFKYRQKIITMPKKLLYALLSAYLSFSISLSYAQSEQIHVPFPESLDSYAVTMRSDTILVNRILCELSKIENFKSTPELMVIAAKKLLETPYVAGTLEGGEKEELRVFLHKTDCILFVESCLNLAVCAKKYGKESNFVKFADLVRQSRYRNGIVENYSDRIHYTTEWIRVNESRGVVEDITQKIGGKVYDHPIFFMSKKRLDHAKFRFNGGLASSDVNISVRMVALNGMV